MMNTIDTYALLSDTMKIRDFLELGDTIDDEVETLLVDYVNQVSAKMETFCDRKFKSREHTEYHDGEGLDYLYPDHYPIVTVSGIYDDVSNEWGASTLVSSSDYFNEDRRITFKNLTLNRGSRNIKIIYTAGYATIPYDLQEVCIKECVRLFKSRKDVHVYSKALEDGSVERYQVDWLPDSKMVLNRYKNKCIV